MDRQHPQRKQIRLQTFDYSSPGVYFLTICTIEKRCFLSVITVGDGVLDVPQTVLSAKGKLVDRTLRDIVAHYPSLILDNYVIMPNHVHLLIRITESRKPPTTGANALIPSFISTFKRFTNKACGEELWQRSYHDHVIRNNRDYEEIWKYIDSNPIRWADDCYAPSLIGFNQRPSL